MEVLGYFGALLMGLILGLIGGGGSILTVPILVYLFAIDTVLATAYSLFIVGLTSLVGSVSHVRHGNVHWRTTLIFGIPSIISVYLTRFYIVPKIPETILQIGDFIVTKSVLMLVIFAVLMIVAAFTMISKKQIVANKTSLNTNIKTMLILSEGVIVGVITGLVGAGGGFLIIPALVIVAKLPMKQAIGTSLIIIALKSLIGFTGDLSGKDAIDWGFLGSFSLVAIVGIIIGSFLSKKIPNEKLKPAFGYFVLIMGVFILVKELFFIN
jgi:uncharacterized protein